MLRAETGTVLWGRWLLGRDGGGRLEGMGCVSKLEGQLESLIDARHGPWFIDYCELRCVKGMVGPLPTLPSESLGVSCCLTRFTLYTS